MGRITAGQGCEYFLRRANTKFKRRNYREERGIDKGVSVISPKANDIVQAGGSYEIQWKMEDLNPEVGVMVTIEFSKNGGKSWEQVEDNVPKAGKYLWKVPTIDSAQCRVRIFFQARPEYRGTSGLFTVK